MGGLRIQAEADLATTLEGVPDFGDAFQLTDPAGFTGNAQLFGQTGDIGALIDPDTGQAVSGRHATLTVRISSLMAAGFSSLPEGVAEGASKPWLVIFAGPATGAQDYKVKASMPDRSLGIIVLILEFWNTGV